METVNIHSAKTHLSELLRRVSLGEEIVIAKSGTPIAKLMPITPETQRPLGIDAGLYDVPDDFDSALPDTIMASFLPD